MTLQPKGGAGIASGDLSPDGAVDLRKTVKRGDTVDFAYRNTSTWFPALVLEVGENDMLTLMVCNHHQWIRERNVNRVTEAKEIDWNHEANLASQGSRGVWRFIP